VSVDAGEIVVGVVYMAFQNLPSRARGVDGDIGPEAVDDRSVSITSVLKRRDKRICRYRCHGVPYLLAWVRTGRIGGSSRVWLRPSQAHAGSPLNSQYQPGACGLRRYRSWLEYPCTRG
jgi:hypothetical protein